MSTNEIRSRRSAVNPLEGPVLGGLLRFCIPIILSGILQILYNTADLVVVGQFCGKASLAAIGATGSLINLFQQLFIGLAVGVNVLTPEPLVKEVPCALKISIFVSRFANTRE